MLTLKTPPIDKELQEHMLALDDSSKKHLIDMKREMCPYNKDVVLESKIGEKLEKENVASQLKTLAGKYGQVYTLNDIHLECQKYNLAFIQADQFKGEITLDLMSRIKKFIDDNEITIYQNDLRYNFMLLAPQAYTRTDEKEFTKNTKNPLVFYKFMDKKQEFYVMIDGSKDYVNFYNLLIGFKNSTKSSAFWFYFILVFTICNLLIIPLDISKLFFLLGMLSALVFGAVSISDFDCGRFDRIDHYNHYKFKTNEN